MDQESYTKRIISENSLSGHQSVDEARNLDSYRLSEAAMVEADDDDCSDEIMKQDFLVAHVPDSGSRSSAAGSSLSGEDEAMYIEELTRPLDKPPTSILRRHSNRMNRSDSRGSNDSSSGSVRNSLNGGNWGWFEDLHGGELHSADTMKNDWNNKRKKVGLLQRFGNHSFKNRSNVTPPSENGEFFSVFFRDKCPQGCRLVAMVIAVVLPCLTVCGDFTL